MNIYMSGAHGTGKSSTAKIIADKTSYGLLPSASRESPYEQGTFQHQDFVMDQVWKRCTTFDEVILERTPFDVYSYTTAMNVQALAAKHEMKMDAFARNVKQQGNVLFYFPITFPLYRDGFRPDEIMQALVDSTMVYHIKRTGIPCLTVPNGTPEERADFILKELADAKLRL